MKALPVLTGSILSLTLLSCTTADAPLTVDLKDAYRFAGTSSGVRVDARIVSAGASGLPFNLVYEVENRRSEPIAIAPGSTVASFDSREGIITVRLGAEIPELDEMIVTTILPGERKRFTAVARAQWAAPADPRLRTAARMVRLKLNFLRGLEGFKVREQDRERYAIAVDDAALPRWLESNESLLTNTLPIGWTAGAQSLTSFPRPSMSRDAGGYR